MNMFRFAHTEYFYALAALPVFILLYWIFTVWRRKRLESFGEKQLTDILAPRQSVGRHSFKLILLLLAYTLIVFALADPQLGTKLEEAKRSGVDVIIALDVSNSMKTDDIKPSRLEKSKQAIFRLISKLRSDRIGIIVFAGKAYTQLPLTTDYAAAKLFLSTVSTDMIPTPLERPSTLR
jgi:Ca-activated chloride channel homolog